MMQASRSLLVLALAIMLTACAAATGGGATKASCTPGADHGSSAAGLKQVELCIRSKGKTLRYIVEVVDTPPLQAKGMMFRTELADTRGMLFPFREPRMASFWMKNTVIPLDIIFIRADGTIENIGENAVPYSLDSVESSRPVTAVLELRGGLTAEVGIAAGDKISWK
jgi:uncharacterized protein